MTPAPRRSLGIHSSGRYDRPLESLTASVRRLRRLSRGRGLLSRQVAYVTGTEAGGRSDKDLERALGSDPGWDFVNLRGAAAECWGTWRIDHLERRTDWRAFSRQLTDLTWERSAEYGGREAPPVEALVVPLQVVGRPNRRRPVLIVVHMPLDNTERRAAAWVDCCRGLRILVTQIRERDPHAEVILEADWNKDHRNSRERAMIHRHLAKPLHLVQGWDGSRPTRGGTHGPRRLIDGVVAPRRVLGWSTPWCWLVPDDKSSDHRPYAHTVRWPLLPKRIRALIKKEINT